MLQSLSAYDTTVNTFISNNNANVTGSNDPLVKTVNDLKLSIALDSNGARAQNLNNALANVLIAFQMVNSRICYKYMQIIC